ncbi:MAG: hypothetical protein WA782_18945 [Sulfitobacter sp.]
MVNGPLFLERQSYRLRRLMDAMRLLPLLGVALWMVPLMWPLPDEANGRDGVAMSTALQYLFGVWLILVVMRWLLWRKTRLQPAPQRDAPE